MQRRRRRRYSYSWDLPPPPPRIINRCRLLLVIDNAPLQQAAWKELQRARRRLEKAAGDIHRHEEKDQPAFRAWFGATFPTLVSTARDLAQQVQAKGQILNSVEEEAFVTGRSPGSIWREWQRTGSSGPPRADNESPPPQESGNGPRDKAGFEQEMRNFFRDEGIDEDDPFADAFREIGRGLFGSGGPQRETADVADARAIYRRLVQQLHPDRGGAWTPARARLWEQVQAAWNAHDADWLARLEAEWDAGTDSLGPTSALGRLRAALAEIHAARRDADRKVRDYRKDVAWRFTLREPSEALRTRLEQDLNHDCAMLRRQLDDIEAAMARWTQTKRRRASRRGAGRAMWQDGMPLF